MFKIAIVGTGLIGIHHVTAIKQVEGCELVALCDINEAVVKPLAEEYGVPYFLDYKEIPEKVDCDAVILNLPHGLHCESTIFFLEKGMHVLLEKPMANTVEECDKMIAAANKSDKKLAIAHPQRYYDAAKKIKAICESGELGKLVMITEQRSINYFLDSRPRWFLSKKGAGGGIVMNYGAHALDKIKSITGAKVTSICSNCDNFLTDHDIEGHAQILGKLDNGASFTVTFSGYARLPYETMYYFTKGAIRSQNSSTLEINRGTKIWVKDTECRADSQVILQEIEEFVKLMNGEESTLPTPEFGREVIASIEKIYENQI